MIYLAILLILCGLLIVITALSIETGKLNTEGNLMSGGVKQDDYHSAKSSSAGSHTEDFSPEEVDIILPGDRSELINDESPDDDIFISFDEEPDDFEKLEPVYEKDAAAAGRTDSSRIRQKGESVRTERRKLDSTGRPEDIEKRENTFSIPKYNDGIVSAIMFDDRSNIIDYESGVGVIDSTFAKYKSIKRIGKGTIESDYDGVNFYLDEKLYRFDFHKVYDIWSGSNYIALPLKGNSTVKLFIIENPAGFPDKVEADFKEYEKGL